METINALDEYLPASYAKFAKDVWPTLGNAIAPNALPVFRDELLHGKGKVTPLTLLVP